MNFVQNAVTMPLTNKFENLKLYFRKLLPSMTEEGWSITESILTTRTFKKGDFFVREGSVCDHVSFINQGSVRMYFLVDGKEKIISFCNELNFVSDYQSFLTRKPSVLFVQALEDTEVVEIVYPDLQMLYQRVPEANTIGRMIAENLFLLMSEGSDAEKKQSIPERYDRLLNEQPWLAQRVPQYMIASYLGITPEAFSRIKSRISRPARVTALNY